MTLIIISIPSLVSCASDACLVRHDLADGNRGRPSGGYIRDFAEVHFERAASKESFGMARVELGAEDQGSKKLIQWLVNMEDFQSL